MRGDSLRDFYAKTLAVLGLGLLAAAGAMVDYWPAGGELPTLSNPANLRAVVPAVVKDFQPQIPAPTFTRARAVAPAKLIASTDVVVPLINDAGGAVLPVPPPPAELAAPADFLVVTSYLPTESWDARDILEPAPFLAPAVASPTAGLQGFVTDALKRTRDSIKDARVSIRGALSGMVGAVRRVSPFFSTTSLGS